MIKEGEKVEWAVFVAGSRWHGPETREGAIKCARDVASNADLLGFRVKDIKVIKIKTLTTLEPVNWQE